MLLLSMQLAILWAASLLVVPSAGAGPGIYKREDLLIAYPTHLANADIINASRIWRRGVRTHALITPDMDIAQLRNEGSLYNESFTVLPDFPGHPHTVRHTLTPIFAAAAVGAYNFSWLLLGDDDTMWVIPAVLRLLNNANISADDPHFISDKLYRCDHAHAMGRSNYGHSWDPRCLPCPADGPKVCPCQLPPECMQFDPWKYQNCSLHARLMPYGGAGMIFSAGLLRLMTARPFIVPLAFERVIKGEPWGDRALAEGPRVLGIGFTQLHDAAQFNATEPNHSRPFMGTYCPYNDGRSLQQALKELQQAAQEEPDVARKTVSFHTRMHLAARFHGLKTEGQLLYYRRIAAFFLALHGEPVPEDLQADAEAATRRRRRRRH